MKVMRTRCLMAVVLGAILAPAAAGCGSAGAG